MLLTAYYQSLRGRFGLLLSLLLAGPALLRAQQPAQARVTLTETNVPLKQVLIDLSKQSGASILYDDAFINSVGLVSIHVTNATLQEALNDCLKNKPLTFRIDNNSIVIRKKPAEPTRNIEAYINIHGSVTDEKDRPLEGASISIKGTGFALATTSSGLFSMGGVPDKGIILFSHVGYETQEIHYDHRTEFNIRLKERVIALGNVTVEVNNGYQILPRERSAGSYDIVDSALFNRSVSPNFLNHLDGVASGVNFDNRETGAIYSYANQGNTVTFSIRGLSTINSDNSPLVIVDGFPYNGYQPYIDNINNLNPNDIESLTVLKDASAASIWGARAGNGVVVITTKSGKYNQQPQVNVNTSVTFTGKPRLFTQRILSTPDYISIEDSLYNQGNYTSLLNPSTAMGKPVTEVVSLLSQVSNGTLTQAAADAQIAALSKIDDRHEELNDFYRTGLDQQYSVTVRGGSPTDKYMVTAGFDDGDAVDFSYQKRFTLTATNSFRLTKNLEFSLPVSFTDNQRGTNVAGNFANTLAGQIAPYSQFTDASGKPQAVTYGSGYNPSFIQTAIAAGLYDPSFNPIEQFHAAQYAHTAGSLIAVGPDLTYSLKSGWRAEVKYLYSKTVSDQTTYQSDSVWSVKNMINQYTQIGPGGALTYPIQQGGTIQYYDQDQVNNDFRATIGYNHNISHDHRIDAIAGYERNETRISAQQYGWYGYNPNTGSVQSTVDYVTLWPNTNNILAGSPYNFSSPVYPLQNGLLSEFTAFVSSFANAGYTYKSRYILNGSARLDQANLFGVAANAKKNVLWSSGVAWQIDRETFYHLHWLPQLKLRATYGFEGNPPAFGIPSVATITYYPGNFNSANLPYAGLNNPANPNLTWEKVGQTNLGLDFGIKGQVLTGTVEYYWKKATNLLAPYPVNPTVGVTTLQGNVGDMSGKGLDLTLASRNIVTRHFRWASRLLLSHNTDKLTKYFATTTATQILQDQSNVTFPVIPTGVPGKAVYGVFSLRSAGLDGSGNPQGYDTATGKPTTNYNELVNYARLKDLVYAGSANPTWFGSFMNDFTYNRFTVSVNISYKAGYYFHAQSVNYSNIFGYGSSVIGNPDGSSDFDKRWQKAGDEKHTYVPSMPTLANSNYLRDAFYQYSSVLVQKGDNIRLKDVSLTYDFGAWVRRSSPFSSIQLYSYYLANTLLWKANKMGIDPDFSMMRPAKSLSLGLRLGLK